MAIIALQKRLREIGRIRLGELVTENGKTRPKKLSTFRFTSRDRQPIDTVAATFGGQVEPWPDAPGGEQWQVVTPVNKIDVIIPPTDMAFSQWYEQWTGGGCVARCDGEREVLHDRPCVCDPNDRTCKPHTRLSLMIPAVPALGVWRLDTLGWNAATELAGAVEAVQMAALRNVMLPARLLLELRQEKKIVSGKAQTRKFAVPVLDVDLSMLMAGAARMAEAASGEIPAARFTPVPLAELPVVPVMSVAEQLSVGPREVAPRANAAAPIRPTGLRPTARGGIVGEIDEDEQDKPVPVSSGATGSDGPPSVSQRSQPSGPEIIDAVSPVLPAGAPASVGEPGAVGSPGSPNSPPDGGGWVLRRDAQIAVKAREAGLDDDGRHLFLEAFTQGRTSSGKDITVEEMPDLMAALVRYKRGQIVISERPDGVPVLAERPDDGGVTDTPPDDGHTTDDGAIWTDQQWRDTLRDAGLRQPAVLRAARAMATDAGIDPPNGLDEIVDPALMALVRDWIDTNRKGTS